jgi:hypothetical protein
LLGAAATLAAVIVSLYLALRSEKPRLKLSAGISLVIGDGDEPPYPQIIDLTVRNFGSLTAHVSQYGWQTGTWRWKWPDFLARQHAIQIPGATGYGKNPPFELAPGKRETSILNFDNFIEGISKKAGPPFFARKWPLLGLRPTPVYVVAHLESGLSLKEPVQSELAKQLFNAEQARAEREVPRRQLSPAPRGAKVP